MLGLSLTHETGALERYSTGRYGEEATRDVSIFPRFIAHDFRQGAIHVIYSMEVRDSKGNLITGSRNIPSQWIIEKIDGRWQVTDIIEAP